MPSPSPFILAHFHRLKAEHLVKVKLAKGDVWLRFWQRAPSSGALSEIAELALKTGWIQNDNFSPFLNWRFQFQVQGLNWPITDALFPRIHSITNAGQRFIVADRDKPKGADFAFYQFLAQKVETL